MAADHDQRFLAEEALLDLSASLMTVLASQVTAVKPTISTSPPVPSQLRQAVRFRLQIDDPHRVTGQVAGQHLESAAARPERSS